MAPSEGDRRACLADSTADSPVDTRGAHSCPPPPFLTWNVAAHDEWRAWTVIAVIGLFLAALLATFGLPPVDLHTPLHHAGIMDPLCGGTRAVRLAAMGQFGQSLTYNPLGLVVILGGAILLVRAAVGITTKRWYHVNVRYTRRRFWIVVIIGIGIVVALEIRQQSIAPLLMGS